MIHSLAPNSTAAARFVAHWAQLRPDAPAIVGNLDPLSFAALEQRVNATADIVSEAGLGRGARLAIVGENRVETAIALLGEWRAGTAVALVNVRLSQAEQDRLIALADVAGVLLCAPGGEAATLGRRDTESASNPAVT